jgi:multiple sugar transport system ATP-binding protein
VRSDIGFVADFGGFSVALDDAWVKASGLASHEGRRLRLGVRPEHISVAGEADAVHPIPVELYSFEPTGAENLYVLRAGNVVVTTRNSTDETAHLGKAEGTRLAMGFDPAWLYVFDPDDGRTIAFAAASRTDSDEA